MSLKEYNKKRDFTKTNEPSGNKSQGSGRFVVQYHKARTDHYDFRLEYNGVLLSWAVPKGLSKNPKVKRLAVKVEDHPTDYIDFEGIIPKGNYGAGTVEIFDSGNYSPIIEMDKGLKKGHVKVLLNGEKLKGVWSLIKTDGENWLAVKYSDEFAKNNDKPSKLPFKKCSVMLATLAQKIPHGKDWVYEIKYDGYRILAFFENGSVTLKSRNQTDYTKKFNKIANALKDIDAENFIVDGEVVAFDENGRSDFGLLQQSIKNGKAEIYFVVFDLIALNGIDLREEPLLKRKEKLERLIYKSGNRLIFSHHVDDGKKCFELAKENNLEGIIAKKASSKYVSSRSENWLKIKNSQRQEFVVCGFTTTEKNEYLSALILGYYDGSSLVYAGKVGTGFSENDKKILHQALSKIKRKTSPFKDYSEKSATFVKPILVAQIKFAEWTKENLLRQPSFLGLREDKNAKEVVREGFDGNKNNKS